MDDIINANSFQQQNEPEILSFRKSMLDYLKEKANARVLLKLMQVSRFFCYPEFPYHAVENLCIQLNILNVVVWKYVNYSLKRVILERMENSKVSKKLWVKNVLSVNVQNDRNFTSILITIIAVCDISKLVLHNQILSFNEWMFISKNITDLTMSSSIVKYDDGAVMPLEKYFECSKNIKYVKFFTNNEMASTITKETAKNLTDIINPSCLIKFDLNYIPDSFDFNVFKEFLKLNKTTAYRLDFIVSQKYKHNLEIFINEIFEANVTEYCPPVLQYNGQDWRTFKALCKLQEEYLNKKKKESK